MYIGYLWESQKGRPRYRWMDSIKMNVGEMEWGVMDWIDLVQDQEGSCEHGNEPLGSIKCWKVLE
jgi:hypothetical protein